MWPEPKKLMIACPVDRQSEIVYLQAAYEQHGIRTELKLYEGKPPPSAFWSPHLNHVDAMLLAGSSRFSPRSRLPGPFLPDATGKRKPVAWLPLKDDQTIRQFAALIQKVHGRHQQQPGIALLAQWHPRYLKLSGRLETILEDKIPTFRWTTDVIGRAELVLALGSGIGMGLYLGHGRSQGWVGYYGLRAHHFEGFQGEPLGCIVALCCSTAGRLRNPQSYAEALPLMGVTAAYFGAVVPTKHTDNTRWAVRMSEAMLNGADNLGELLIQSAPMDEKMIRAYRIIGDPLAPLFAEYSGIERGYEVKTYP